MEATQDNPGYCDQVVDYVRPGGSYVEDRRFLELILPVLEPFLVAQRMLESHKYVRDNLVIPTVHGRCLRLNNAIGEVLGLFVVCVSRRK